MSPEDGRCIPNFIKQAVSAEPITIYGSGSQTRSFCYIDDTVDALVRLMNAPGGRVGPVNLGNPVEHTILEIAEIVKARVGSDSPLVMAPLPADDPKIRRPDIAKAERELGWRPSTSLLDGLDLTIAWVRERLKASSVEAFANPLTSNQPALAANPFRKSDDKPIDRRAVTTN